VLTPIVRATLAATLLACVAVAAVSAAPRTARVDRADVVGTAASASVGDAAATDAWPTPTAAAAGPGGDIRSSGEGAGLAGSPLLAFGVVLAIAAGTTAVTLVYVRLTAGRDGRA